MEDLLLEVEAVQSLLSPNAPAKNRSRVENNYSIMLLLTTEQDEFQFTCTLESTH